MINKRGKRESLVGLIVLILYTGGLIFVSCFHELWFDETQAWQIARCASFKEILTVVPRYEGHPPFWHLLLTVFAKNGAPVDLTLKAINITFSTAAMALLIFRSPFPKAVRYILPFTYFFFYQYGVYSRPYSMIMLEFMLIAIFYKERNTKPWRYIFTLVLLCLSHAYGIMLAGGLCLVWTFEIIVELYRNKKFVFFWKDKRFYSLCFILAIAVILIITILPADDCYYAGLDDKKSFKEEITNLGSYMILVIFPVESWSGAVIGMYKIKEYTAVLIAEAAIGLLIWLFLIVLTKKNKKLFTFIVPYTMMTLFMSFNYMSVHHIGLSALYHVFIFWIMAEQDGGIKIPKLFIKINNSFRTPVIRRIIYGVGGIICLMPVVYSVGTSYMDIKGECGSSKFAEIIKENHLENKKIMVSWECKYEKSSDDNGIIDMNLFRVLEIPSEHGEITINRTYLMDDPAMILPYFDKNIFMNFNVECPDDLYMHYKYKEDSVAIMQKWREKGLPDFIIDYCPIDEIYDEKTLEGVKYLPVYLLEYNIFYKLDFNIFYERLYIREDLFDEYPQFRWIDDQRGNIYERK